MPKHKSLSRIRRNEQAQKKRVWFAQAVTFAFRAVYRVQELFAPPERRQKLRQFRQKMNALDAENKVLFEQLKHGSTREGLDALDAMQERHARPEDRARLEEERASRQAMRQESDNLLNILKASNNNPVAAAQGFREYLALHPESARALSGLGRSLLQMGDLHSSLTAYRDALHLAGSNLLPGVGARWGIAEVLSQQGDMEVAVAELRGIIDEAIPQTNAMLCPTFFQLGNMYHKMGERQQARAAWKQVIEWDTTTTLGKKAQELLKENP